MRIAAAFLLAGMLAAPCVAAPPSPVPTLTTLAPGAFREIPQNLTVNVVFVGFPAGSIDTTALTAALPGVYKPIHRYPNFYGLRQFVGNKFNFSYNVVQADPAYADALFSYLGSIAAPQPRTLYQDAYNSQSARGATVGQNHWIDAPTAETWLAQHPPAGVNTGNYTVYFINWWGRSDFKFHVYTKTDAPDPDTGYNFGQNRASRKIVAWGGTPPAGSDPVKRVWFYDFSAGPESWNGNYDITNADVDGDGVPDYRIPAIWDYGNPNGYRAFNDFTGDAAKLVRFVAIDLLFTTSPLYKPAISPPELPGSINVDMTFYQGDPTSDARDYYKPVLVTQELTALQPHNTFTADVGSRAFTARAAQTYLCFFTDHSCYGNRLFGIAFGDLFLYHSDTLLQDLEGNGDYEVPVFGYNVTDDLTGGLLGFADDNWADGTQSYVFAFLSPLLRNFYGYGFTTTTIHEVGHHLGMSHPHDGYDYELDLDYGGAGDFYFSWSGDESNSIMHYLDLSTSFSQFDRDNMNRWMTATYVNQANAVLAAMYKSPRIGQASAALAAADANAALALTRYAAMNYAGAAAAAKAAYVQVLAAAAAIKVKVEPQAWQADYKAKGKSTKFIDTVDYLHRLAP
jgi:hypothetical protein